MGTHASHLRGAGGYLAKAKQATGHSEEAAALFQKLVATCRVERSESGVLAQLLLDQASLFNAMGRFTEAENGSRETLQIFRDLFGETFWRAAAAMVVLGEALLGQRQYDAAEPLMSEGYDALVKAPGEGSASEAAAAAERIRALYDAQGRSDMVARW